MKVVIDDYPGIYTLIYYGVCGIISNLDKSGGFRQIRTHQILIGEMPKGKFTIQQNMLSGTFGLMVCKMAYLFAVSELGIDGFDGADMRALLSGERDDMFNFFGDISAPFYKKPTHLHELHVRKRGNYQTVVVHLFSELGAMPYEVVVGRAV